MTLIGIGVGEDPDRVIFSIQKFAYPDIVRCYAGFDTNIPESFPFPLIKDPNPGSRMVHDLIEGKVDAAVRGSLPAHQTLSELKEICKVSFLERIVLIETISGIKFFLAPVGIDEGFTVYEKISLINKGRNLAKAFGLSEQVSILSGGRLGDLGRHPVVDRTLSDAELVSRITGARHDEILIEESVKDAGLIIAPDGISGNLIFRTLLFLGNAVSHGAPVVNISKIFVDTSRVNPDYSHALFLAYTLCK